MLTGLKEILALAEEGGFAVPAFNVYNMETVMGVAQAAEELRAPVILQCYSRLFDGEEGEYLSRIILRAAEKLRVPVCYHLDHGAGLKEVVRALRWGATGVMLDVSLSPLESNTAETKKIVELCAHAGVAAEGELGHIGSTSDAQTSAYTDPAEAEYFVKETGVAALAVMVGTAHGRYKKAPVLDTERIAEIKQRTNIPLVLHGGSGVPDVQIRAAIGAGIRKVNFGTDLCYSFLDGVFASDRSKYAVDLFMKQPVSCVKAFAQTKIRLLGAEGRV